MGTKPLPSLRVAFSEVRREESRKKVMMGSNNTLPTIDGSALAIRNPSSSNNFTKNQQRKGRLWCDHCRKPSHTKETCGKLHGRPADWKPYQFSNYCESRSNVACFDHNLASQEQKSFNKDLFDMLQKLISNAYQPFNPLVIGIDCGTKR